MAKYYFPLSTPRDDTIVDGALFIPLFHMDVILYSCPNSDSGVANLC